MVSIAAGHRIAVIIILIVSASSSVLSKTTKNATQIEHRAPIIAIARTASENNNAYRVALRKGSTTRKHTDQSEFYLVARNVALLLAVIAPLGDD